MAAGSGNASIDRLGRGYSVPATLRGYRGRNFHLRPETNADFLINVDLDSSTDFEGHSDRVGHCFAQFAAVLFAVHLDAQGTSVKEGLGIRTFEDPVFDGSALRGLRIDSDCLYTNYFFWNGQK